MKTKSFLTLITVNRISVIVPLFIWMIMSLACAEDVTLTEARWTSMGVHPGANGHVRAMIADDSGMLYVGGFFSTIDDLHANSIAKWDGNRWSFPW